MAKTRAKPRSIYGVHPAVRMIADWIDGLKEKTGRTLPQWIKLAKKDGPDDGAALRLWFKEHHGFGTNHAWLLAERVAGRGWVDGDPDVYLKQAQGYVRDMYAGGKAGLKPIHDAILAEAAALGEDMKACPCRTIVPLYRRHVFAQVKPSTKTRIDLGLALAKYDGDLSDRLIDTGGQAKGDRITHRIPIAAVDAIDAEVRHWLKVAYELDG